MIKVYCSASEKDAINATAKSVDLTTSNYLLKVGLGYEPLPVIDAEHMMEMGRHVANLGRLGGVLKLWLSQDKAVPGVEPAKVRAAIRRILNGIEANQDLIETTVAKIVNARVRAAGAANNETADAP